ncbi:P-loop NTPase fold protein [Bacillus cereus]|uniref:KAP family P-loop NTPase fold protein n=1 Tax=Bacillus cereus TaxID=1396 RepID=UPI00356EB365
MDGYLPLSNIESDKLHFSTKSNEIAKFIESVPNTIPYAISINGSWGSGKSTMLNFIEGELNTGVCKVVRFNPWMINNKEELILHLFEEIYDCIDQGATNAKEKFKNYALKIASPLAKLTALAVSASQGVPTPFITPLVNVAGDITKETGDAIFNKPLSKRKKELINELKMMFVENGQKIVVMIDEVDRLFPDEIVNIFQLIKSTLDLPGLLFIVAMDENAVCDALESKGIKNSSIYLQKIFQKKYVVNTQFQLRTLFEEFVTKQIQDVRDAHNRDLLYLIDTFIEMNRENYLGTASSRYAPMNDAIREHLENPRAFVDFKDFLFEKWEKYYSEIPVYHDRNAGLQVAFVILMNFYLYPNYNNPKFSNLQYLYQLKADTYPNFVVQASNIIKDISIGTEIAEIQDFVGTIVHNLNKYPDYIRSLKDKV